MCTGIIGKADAMSPQEQFRYKEAMGELPSQQPRVEAVTPQTSLAIPKDSIQLPNGKYVSPKDYAKLQQKLKSRS